MIASRGLLIAFLLIGGTATADIADVEIKDDDQFIVGIMKIEAEMWAERHKTIVPREVMDTIIDEVLNSLGADDPNMEEILSNLPIIHVAVEPVPPRDYTMEINGRSFPATELSQFAFLKGKEVKVVVRRAGYPPCEWSGSVRENATVHCRFDKP